MSDEQPALCTTNGKSVSEVREGQTNETGQHDGYIVLCPDERAKGFVRPYRDRYQHVGRMEGAGTVDLCPRCGAGTFFIKEAAVDRANQRFCADCAHIWEPEHRAGGCNGVTTMGRALSETYARNPNFYSHTFCVSCNRHLPVAEFVWTADGAQVGS